jgi:tetratricopeptide (TPR) repeat protein
MKKRSIILLCALCYFALYAHTGKAEPYTVLMRKGNRYYRNTLYHEAGSIEALNEALTRTDDDERISQIRYNLGNNYFNLGEYAMAVEHYRAGLKKDPYDLNLKYNLELALKKLADQTPQPERPEKPENGNGKSGETDGGKDTQGQDSPDETEQENREFSAEDASRLIHSVNTDQSRIINELIQSRVGKVQNENDW